ncbi:MAG: proline--tRNA ligase, partial [Cyclobacteriaceae bacterium]
IQEALFSKALSFREEKSTHVNTLEEFKEIINEKGGFVYAHWDGTKETELKIKDLTKATIRCIPLNNKKEEGNCILTGKPSSQRVVFAKAY